MDSFLNIEDKKMNLQEFVKILKLNNELFEINEFVDPQLEITEIVDRISKSNQNKALLFTNNGTNFPVLINAFGSEKRIALALHAKSLEEIEENIASIFKILTTPKNISDKFAIAKQLFKFSTYLPKVINKKGECQQVIDLNPDLNKLPILKCWPLDGGKFITLPLVHTKSIHNGKRNLGMYRMQVFSGNTTGMHWHIHKTGAMHFNEYKKQGKKIPIAVCLGGDPVYSYCATAPLPEGIDEYILAGFLRKKRVKLVKCITQDIEVPEDVDFVIEGYIDPNEPLKIEGPFGDHTGFYSLQGNYPVFHVTAITHKKNAIYPATIVGIPPQEDYWFIKASERIFLQFLKNTLLNEIIDMHMPDFGVAHNLVIIQIEPQYPQHASKIAHALWGIGQMMLNKIIIITNENIKNTNILFNRIIRLKNWKDRILLSYGPLDVLEHSSIKPTEGGKLAFNAIINNELDFISEFQSIEIIDNNLDINTDYAPFGIIIIYVEPDFVVEKEHIHTFFKVNNSNELKIFLVDKQLKNQEFKYIAWHFMANFDPSLDFKIIDNYLIFNGSIKTKNNRKTPNPTISSLETIQNIDKKWSKLLSIPIIESPSKKLASLKYGNNYIASFDKN
ncbi:MAG: menaquinone biosynthesis decarboxylase [Bacteroidales bacterium]